MTSDAFWDLIALGKTQVAEGVDPLCERQAAVLETLLSRLSPSEIIDFDRIFRDCMEAANDWRLWGAAYIINGGCSDDGFAYFRGWLIAHGRDVYTTALRDPDALVDFVDGERDDYEGESMLYAAGQAYKATTGSEMSYTVITGGNTRGVHWTEKELDQMLPRLTLLYGLN
jgi:hypothetical protein